MILVRLRHQISVLVACMVMYALITPIPSEAAPNNFISLVRSDTCAITDCILIKDLIKYDNSTQSISGAFVYKSALGDYTREKGMQNAHNYYQIYSDRLFVFVEPDQSTLTRSKVITLERTLPTYITQANQVKYEIDFHTDKRVIQYGMWFDSKCNSGIVGIDNGNIADAITHMASNCTGTIENTEEIITPKTSRDVCLTQCQYEKWFKAAKEKSKTTFLINAPLGNIITAQHYLIHLIE